VPQLQFKRDLIPGQTNTMWLQADEAGTYRSLCAEYCGLQHAQMHFMVVALEPADYEQWVAHEGSDAAKPSDPLAKAGQQVFLGKSCMYCHAIRGTPAAGEVGPDLTHLASRLTIAAGTLENNTGNLGGWILDPQHIKPGALMPPTPLMGQELQELLAYLNSLK
jgi:cytochrome c oxidase subunit II